MWHRAALIAVVTFVLGWATTLSYPADAAPRLAQPVVLPTAPDLREALLGAEKARKWAVMQRSIDRVLAHEGGFANRARDPGGPTRYGITESTARQFGYRGSMAALPIEVARFIYESLWRLSGASNIGNDELAFQAFDSYVNHGPRSIRWVAEATSKTSDRYHACLMLNDFRTRAYQASKNWPIFKVGWMARIEKNRAECA